MARVPITVMGFRCDRCAHEWIPRGDEEPRVCPACHSALWNQPDKKARMSFDDFKSKIAAVLREAGQPLTWTEIRTKAALPHAFPNNQWVHRMEADIGLIRKRESDGIIHWQLKESLFDQDAPPAKATNKVAARAGRK
ncbi:MAG: zinc ribbon domain-containing protein [Bradyrhizobiaceae bacterium]|nr:zinc ribbon domain-containing protein [Bradyrhizobiaceae bacterium]